MLEGMSKSTTKNVPVARQKFVRIFFPVCSIATLIVMVQIEQIASISNDLQQVNNNYNDNSIDQQTSSSYPMHKHIACGTISSNYTHVVVKNPHHPEPTYVRAICETVVERSSMSVSKLTINFKELELYRPNYDGSCIHDRFAVYTDLNIPVIPNMCGNLTGQTVSIPFAPSQTSLIVSITTSDLDHDRSWVLEIEQSR